MGDANRALVIIEKALSDSSDVPIFNYHMGMVLYKLERMDEAREKLMIALESDKAFPGREDAKRTLEQIS